MRSFDWKAGLPFALALAASCAVPQHAFAQFFFRPFANAFRYQIPDEGPPAFASRPAVASILGRAGYQLVGPLGRRGDQIVATGVSRRDGEMRFIIDPYAGRILRAVRLGPPPMYGGGPRDGGDYGPADRDSYESGRRSGEAPYVAGGRRSGSRRPGPAAGGFDNERNPERYPQTDRAPQAPDWAALDHAPDEPTQQRASAAKGAASSKTSRAIAPPKPAAPAAASASTKSMPAPSADPSAREPKSNVDAVATPAPAAPQRVPELAPAAADKPASTSTESKAGAPAQESQSNLNDTAKTPPAPNSAEKAIDPGAAAPPAQAAKEPGDTPAASTETEKASATAPAPSPAAEAAKPHPESAAAAPSAPAASAERSAPAKRAAAARAAGLSRRAIVPPHASSGTTVVSPAASAPQPSGAATAKTPDDAKATGG
ncbi:MAG: hypothetical protein HYS63_00500 [Methylocystis sp.]|nr:hypothetical protein [Methylocystis sp.]